MSLGISFVICCHNSAGRLPETLRHLAAQKNRPGTEWEVVVVDNASTDDTAAVARKAWALPGVSLRVVEEPQPGLSHARVCGAHAARHEVISFIDDDNYVCEEWLETVVDIFSHDAAPGAVGGFSEAVFDSPPPWWFGRIQSYYAVGDQHEADGDVTNVWGTILWGAGLTMQKTAILSLLANGFEFLATGRKGLRLSTGEDSELCFALRAAGCKFMYDRRLRLKHYMPATRLTWDYALKLMRGMGEASTLLVMYMIALRGHPFDRQPPVKRTWGFQFLKALKDLCLLFLKHPIACIKQPEGCMQALEWQKTLGRLGSLLALRAQYNVLIRRLESARWNLGGAGGGGK